MNKTMKVLLIVFFALVGAVALLWAGVQVARAAWYGPVSWMGGMMGAYNQPGRPGGPGGANSGGCGMWGGAYAANGQSGAEPLSLEQAQGALHDYLEQLGNDDLEIKEVMIFDNHAYAILAEKSSGIGAMEVLVDPVSLAVYPEHGPNMMWNLKYGMMSGYGGSGGYGMMGGYGMTGRYRPGVQDAQVSAEMPVSPEQASEYAQRYLDSYLPGSQAEDHADPFYGYYTLHILQDGQVTGMLSVNGYSGQVFLHTWHGNFIEMTEEGHSD